MIRVYTGELLLIWNKIEKVIANLDSMNVSRFDEISEMVFHTAKQCPFLAEKRVVILALDILLEDERLMNYIKRPAPLTDFYIVVRKIDKRTKLYKMLIKENILVEQTKIKEERLYKWIGDYMTLHNKIISSENIRYLVDRTEYLYKEEVDLYRIENILKMLSFVPEKEIRKKVIDEIVPETESLRSYMLSNLLLEQKNKELFLLAEKLLEQGEEPIALLSFMERVFRLAYKATLFPENLEQIGVPPRHYKIAMRYEAKVIGKAMDYLQEGVHIQKTDLNKRVGFIQILYKVSKLLSENS